MPAEDFFARHPRPQAPSVPTYGALIRQQSHLTSRAERTDAHRVENSPSKAPAKPTDAQSKETSAHSSASAFSQPAPSSPPATHVTSTKSELRRFSAEHTPRNASSPPSPRQTPPSDSHVHVHESSPWTQLRCLGTMVQGPSEHALCVKKGEPQTLVMVKRVAKGPGMEEASSLRRLSHPNIVELRNVFLQGDEVYLELRYCRHTLEEVMNVHLKFEEVHVRLIAQSVCEISNSRGQKRLISIAFRCYPPHQRIQDRP